MSVIRKLSGFGSRPYPLDHKRRRKVLHALVERDMTISELARSLGLSKSVVSRVVSGRRISPKTEQRIADFLGKPADYLFPARAPVEIKKMRSAEAAQKGKLA